MPKPKSYITIMIIPDQESEALKIRLSRPLFRAMLAVIVAMLLLFLAGVFMGGKLTSLYASNENLKQDNKGLRQKVEKIASIEQELQKIDMLEKWVMNITGVEPGGAPAPAVRHIENEEIIGKLTSLDTIDVKERTRFIPRGLPLAGRITAQFGEKESIFSSPHTGVDIAATVGRPVFSTAAGVVSFAGNTPDLGNTIHIEHISGYETIYGHLERLTVQKGDIVDKNAIIGFCGASGRAIGSHTHYEVKRSGKPIDPLANEEVNYSLR